jgi:amidohydrolase family protein
MRVNCHAHIYNLRSVLTRRTISLIADRLTREQFPPFAVAAVSEVLEEYQFRPEYLVEEELLTRLLRKMVRQPTFRSFVLGEGVVPPEIRLLAESRGTEALSGDALRALLDKLSTAFNRAANGDGRGTTLSDLVETLRIALQPEITDVADRLLERMRPDDALVALATDLTAQDESDGEQKLFWNQLVGTRAAALRHPGRVLPFVGVDTQRSEHFETLQHAVERFGFVGVKLYPSLGSQVDTPAMDKIYSFCIEHELPIVVHCSRGGFQARREVADNSRPELWRPVFAEYPDLRVCFAHFGGWAGLGQPDGDPWSQEIMALMRDFEWVFADVSGHVDMMQGGEREATYFRNLKRLLAEAPYANRILFGTDSWLARLRLADEHYWQYFAARLSDAEFQWITEDTPRLFLGLPNDTGIGERANMRRFVSFVVENRDRLGAEPTRWVRQLVGRFHGAITFSVSRTDAGWSPNNEAHYQTFRFFRREQLAGEHERMVFEETKHLRLRQMLYWNREHDGADIFQRKCYMLAEHLDEFFRKRGAADEEGSDRSRAVAKLAGAVAEGGRTLADLGRIVDALYRFRAEGN